MTIEIRIVDAPPDIAAPHVARVREVLRTHPGEFLSVPELVAATGSKDVRVREAIDRLSSLGELRFGLRYVPGRRGTAPRVYSLKQS